jgi:hypothetical protein
MAFVVAVSNIGVRWLRAAAIGVLGPGRILISRLALGPVLRLEKLTAFIEREFAVAVEVGFGVLLKVASEPFLVAIGFLLLLRVLCGEGGSGKGHAQKQE